MTKSQAYYNSIKEDRCDWRDTRRQRCMACSRPFSGFHLPEVHEIERRGQAQNRWWHRCNALLLCMECHIDFGSAAEWPHARQLALKRRQDCEHFDLKAWLVIRGRPESYVTADELDEWDRRDQ